MADKKISELSAVTTISDTDEYPLARAGATNKITGANLKATHKSSEDIMVEGMGLQAWNYHPAAANVATTTNTQEIWCQAIGLRAGQVVTNLGFLITTGASGSQPTSIQVGLASGASTGVVLVKSGELKASAGWTTVGVQLFAMTAPYDVLTNGLYYVLFLIDGAFGSSQITFARTPPNAATSATNGMKGMVSARAGTGQTTLPAVSSSLPAAYSWRVDGLWVCAA